MIRSNERPIASSSDQPKRFVAASFQKMMAPAGSARTTASARLRSSRRHRSEASGFSGSSKWGSREGHHSRREFLTAGSPEP
jgi:hypothetical protein